MTKMLTAAAVRKVRAAKRRLEIPDGGCPGLHLIVQPTGAKSWALRYRRPDKRPAKLVLGSVYDREGKGPDTDPAIGDHLTLAAARHLTAQLRHQIAQGRDPGAAYITERRTRSTAALEAAKNSFAAAARDFIKNHASRKTRRWKEQARLLGIRPEDLEVIPKGLSHRWGKRPVAEINGQDVWNVVDETRRSGVPGLVRRRVGPTESRARAILSCLSCMFSWLLRQRRVSHNPCSEIHRPDAPRARDRFLSDKEIVKFWSAIQGENKIFANALRLLLLTGCRLNEVASMKRTELSDNLNVWTIPAARTKNRISHIVPLSRQARDILIELNKPIPGTELLFSTNGRSSISGWSKVKARLDQRMNVPHWRLHDLRRTAATGMAELGVAPHIVEAALNHVSGAKAGVAGTYNRAEYMEEKRSALQRWADHIEALSTTATSAL